MLRGRERSASVSTVNSANSSSSFEQPLSQLLHGTVVAVCNYDPAIRQTILDNCVMLGAEVCLLCLG